MMAQAMKITQLVEAERQRLLDENIHLREELENTIERAVLVCDGSVVHGHHLPPTLQTSEATGTTTNLSLDEAVIAYEKDLVQDALKSTRGNRAKAAKLLHSTERIIGYKVKKYGIDCRRFRS